MSGIQNPKVEEEATVRTFYDWLIHTSPFKASILSEDTDLVMKDRVLVFTPHVAPNELLGGVIAARAISEYPRVALAYEALIKAGLHPSLSFLFAHHLAVSKNKFYISSYTAHCAINKLDDVYVVNFLTGNGTLDSGDSYYETVKYYATTNNMWGQKKPVVNKTVVAELPDFLKNLAVEKKPAKKTNPFAVEPAGYNPYDHPSMEFLPTVCEHLNNEYKELLV